MKNKKIHENRGFSRVKQVFILTAFIILAAFLCSCSPGAQEEDSVYESQSIIIEGLPGGTVGLSISELRALPQHDLDASYQRTTGLTESFTMKGPYLKDVINAAGGELSDYAGVGVIGSDAYYCLISREIIDVTPDLMLAVSIDGAVHLDDGVAPAQLAVPGQFGPYWVKMVERLVLYTEVPKKEITSVWAFNSLTEGIEPYLYEYYGSKDASIELAQIFSRLDYVDSRAFFTMKSSDGFKKNEVINMVKSRYYIKTEGQDAPTNISPYIKLGMNVHNIAWFSTNADAAIFLEEMLTYMDTADVGGYTGIPLDEVLYEVEVEALRGKTFQISGVQGENVTVAGEELSKAILVPAPSGAVRVVWHPECGYSGIESLMRIRMIGSKEPEETSQFPAGTAEPGGQDPSAAAEPSGTAQEEAPPAGSPPTDVPPAGAPPVSSPSAAAPSVGSESPKEDTVLTITGDGVERTLYFSLDDLKGAAGGYSEGVYSIVNNWPTKNFAAAKGTDIRYLLSQAGLKPGAGSIKVEAGDGYFAVFTKEQLLGTLYSYPDLLSGSSGGAASVPPIAAWAFKNDSTDLTQVKEGGLRLFLGQNGLNNANETVMVKQMVKITVTAGSPGQWPQAAFSLENGLLTILHDFLDQVKIYYTTDGTEPTIHSAVYNPSTTYFQPQLIQPLPVDGVTVVKAAAIGFGRYDSEVAVYEITP